MNLLKLRDFSSSASVIVTPTAYSPASQQLSQTRGRIRRWVSEGAVRRLVNGNSCKLNDTESVYDLD